jgi:hypothetical protein
MYAIVRVKGPHNAWNWMVDFRRRGKLYCKRFFDLKLGGKKEALAEAIAWRNRTLVRAKVFTHREFCQRERSNNTSGATGVHFIRKKRKQPLGVWQARIELPDGRKVHKSFSVRMYGYTEAFRRAVAARQELLLLVDERPFVHHPVAKRLAAKRKVTPMTKDRK